MKKKGKPKGSSKTRAASRGAVHPDALPECWTTFLGVEERGWGAEREQAAATFEVGKRYKIQGGSMSQSSSRIWFEGIQGSWNTVFFDVDIHSCPLIQNPYILFR
jgi:hypothetical protein